MGHIRHRVVIATVPLYLGQRHSAELPGHDIPQLLEHFRDGLPHRHRRLLQGPILSDVNGVHTWFFSTAASTGGWEDDNDVYAAQERFIEIFDRPETYLQDGGHLCSLLVLRWPADAGLGHPITERRLASISMKAPDFHVGDLVRVDQDSDSSWLGKIIALVVGDHHGAWSYRVRVTSRSQRTPACGTVVTVAPSAVGCLRLRPPIRPR